MKNWAVFHMHMDTKEMVRMSPLELMTEHDAMQIAEALRIGRGRSGARDRWTVVAAEVHT